MKLKNMKRIIALGLAMMMAAAVVPASSISAKTKYKTVKEDGKEYIVFGSYEQDGNTKNGKEPIEWEVLGEDKNGILVVSRYSLDCQPYNKEWTDVTWKTCTLRKWLNKKFYNAAFSSKDKKKIKSVNVENTYILDGITEVGMNTKDKIFCLSFDEIQKYYRFNIYYDKDNTDKEGHYDYSCYQDLIISPTQYAQHKGVWTYFITEESYKNTYKRDGYTEDCINRWGGSWWLRTTGHNSDYAGIVDTDGRVGALYDYTVDYAYAGVRPAMYLKK